MTALHFPKDLVSDLEEAWETVVGGDVGVDGAHVRPVLPSHVHLSRLIEVLYVASQLTEELRPLRFFAACAPESEGVIRQYGFGDVEAWEFEQARPFNTSEVRRLASAVDIDSSALWISFPVEDDSDLKIRGVVNFGSSWSKARSGSSYHYESLPHALNIRVDGAGALTTYQGNYALSALRSGVVRRPQVVPTLDLLGIHSLIAEIHQSLSESTQPPEDEPPREWHQFEWIAITNTLLSIVNMTDQSGHGGTVVLCSPGDKALDSIKFKYKLGSSADHIRLRLVDFLNLRHRRANRDWTRESSSKADSFLIPELETAQRDLADACRLVAGMAAVDGALVISTDLSVLGFGAEVILGREHDTEVKEVTEVLPRNADSLNSEQFGMRHRSTMRLCASGDKVAAFVVSQDGGASLVWKDNSEVCFKKGVPTTNANMVLA